MPVSASGRSPPSLRSGSQCSDTYSYIAARRDPRHARAVTEEPGCGPLAAQATGPGPELPSVPELVADLRLLRERGLVRIRHTELATLRLAASLAPVVPAEGIESTGPRAIEALLRAAVAGLGGGQLGAAAEHTFGLNRGGRDRPAQDRRLRAAQEYGVSQERFRKHHERIVVEQIAEEILELCQPARGRRCGDAERPGPARQIRMEGRSGAARFPVTVHVEPVELLHDVDVVVAPSNVYLELPQPYKASVSAALRRAAARRGPDGAIVADAVSDELRSWLSQYGRPGMQVAAGSVVPTSAGALSDQNIRRIYHAAITTPRPGTNDYDVMPVTIAQAVYATFALARRERPRFTPPLASLGFPLLGAGRGGLDPATSFAWIWTALERELRQENSWTIHFITNQWVAAEAIFAGISQSGGVVPARRSLFEH
jgi:O-acetyl-ADP-ribose deacetylase (regulator of RNase III)